MQYAVQYTNDQYTKVVITKANVGNVIEIHGGCLLRTLPRAKYFAFWENEPGIEVEIFHAPGAVLR